MPPSRPTYLAPFQCRQALKDIREGMSKTQLSLKYHCHWEQMERRLRSYNEPLFEEALVIRGGTPPQVNALDEQTARKLHVRMMAEFDESELTDLLAKVLGWKAEGLAKKQSIQHRPKSWIPWDV